MIADPTGRLRPRFPLWRTVVSIALGGLFLGLLYTRGQFFRKEAWPLLLFLLTPALLAGMLWFRAGRPRRAALRHEAPLLILFGCLLLFLCSSAPLHRWFFFLDWLPGNASPLKAGLVRLVLLASLLVPLFLRPLRKVWIAVVLILVGSQAYSLLRLIQVTGGAALYRTDHPSFMFRLMEFSRCFPQLENYNPYWNAGTLHWVGVTSGTAGPGLLLWPLWRFSQIHDVYTYGVGTLFILFVPWMSAFSVRAMGGGKVAAATAGILALGVSQHFFLWMLHYGTIGAALSSTMILPVSALAFRVVCLGRTERWAAAALVLASFFLLLWPPGAILGACVAVTCVLHARRWTVRKLVFLALCGLAVLLLWWQWGAVLLTEGNQVVDFVLDSGRGAGRTSWWPDPAVLKGGFRHLVDHIREGQPLLIFFGLAGACVAGRRGLRTWFIPILFLLAVITGWGQHWRPHSQLSRVSIPMFFVAVAPASMLVGRLLRTGDMRLAVVRAALAALLMLSGYNVSRLYANKGLAPYVVKGELVNTLSDWIKANVPEGGRVLFAGKCLHAYGRGNVAYLPILTGREMMADDYYGFPPGTIEYEYPPRAFRKSFEKMKLFLDAYNVTHVITYHDKWKEYFGEHDDFFRKELSVPSFHLGIEVYSLARGYRQLLKGEGRVRARFNRIDVELSEPADEVVLTYNWCEGLTSPDAVDLFAVEVEPGITLIGVRPNGKSTFRIEYRNVL